MIAIIVESKLATWMPEVSYSLILTVIGGIWTLLTYLNGKKDTKLKEEISVRETKAKDRLESIRTIRQLNNELKIWADEVIDILSEIGHMCEIDPKRDPDFFKNRIRLLIKLSALIDQGRFYLPNTDKNLYGQDKPFAFQGITREPLTQMKECYRILDKEISFSDQTVNKPLKVPLMLIKRSFCSSIQKELNPENYFIGLRDEISGKI